MHTILPYRIYVRVLKNKIGILYLDIVKLGKCHIIKIITNCIIL